ncbi:hypothetical protein MKY96_33830 [Paenibacillus sp. FSL R7-0302]
MPDRIPQVAGATKVCGVDRVALSVNRHIIYGEDGLLDGWDRMRELVG